MAAAMTSYEVTLRNGDTLSIEGNIDLFKLTAEDRTFVYSVLDQMRAYAEKIEAERVEAPRPKVPPAEG